jgi:hypothetical protein
MISISKLSFFISGWEALAQSVKNGFGEFACDSSRRME